MLRTVYLRFSWWHPCFHIIGHMACAVLIWVPCCTKYSYIYFQCIHLGFHAVCVFSCDIFGLPLSWLLWYRCNWISPWDLSSPALHRLSVLLPKRMFLIARLWISWVEESGKARLEENTMMTSVPSTSDFDAFDLFSYFQLSDPYLMLVWKLWICRIHILFSVKPHWFSHSKSIWIDFNTIFKQNFPPPTGLEPAIPGLGGRCLIH